MTQTKKKVKNALALMAALAALALSGPAPNARGEESAPKPSPAIPQNELRALSTLFRETGLKADPCRTRGVTCRDGHVVKLTPHDQGIWGRIPPDLGNLAGLEELDLSGNRLTGAIPKELGRLTRLKYLRLSENRLTGPIPPELGNLAGLESLDIPGNRLTGPIPAELGKAAALKRLDLSVNRLSGSLPPEMGNLENLETLYLWANRLTGEFPAEMTRLSRLKWLNVAYNGLEARRPETARFLSSLAPGWEKTQTRPPAEVAASWQDGAIRLTWPLIPYTADGGEHLIVRAVAPEGPYVPVGKTPDKNTGVYVIDRGALEFPERFFYAVQTRTPPHALGRMWGKQRSEVLSRVSPPAVAPGLYRLIVQTAPPGMGTVEGVGHYLPDSEAVLKAVPGPGASFAGWSGDAYGKENPLKIQVDEPKQITAQFSAPRSRFLISATARPRNGGTVSGAGAHRRGARVTLTARPAPRHYFLRWTGDVSSRLNPLVIRADGPKKITAQFMELGH
ncbi:exported hypothetical protein [Candidatus Desulfarcum epimagneticum]|uniref:Bacterial repeat domain-containing protein n=1 Tax=uncultured Desulfobacteraceae bacterium TaxID=218296 RepID=A0A484HPA2_9BACT|nr:exported hypothetical protein [uncultured Desulfobacteraceae bacterium]